MQVQGRTVLITGAGRGIGRSVANRFGRDGAHVALLDMNQADLDSARTELESMRPKMLEKLVAPVPLRRLGEPQEIAGAAAFIAGNDYINGACIDIDGGLRF